MERQELFKIAAEGRKTKAMRNSESYLLKYAWAKENKLKTEKCVNKISNYLNTIKSQENEYLKEYYSAVKDIGPEIDQLRLEVEAARIAKRIYKSFKSVCEVLFKKDANRIYEILAIYRAIEINNFPLMPKTAVLKLGEALESKNEFKRQKAREILEQNKENGEYLTLKEVKELINEPKKNETNECTDFTKNESTIYELSSALDEIINDINEGWGLSEKEEKDPNRLVVLVSSLFDNSYEILNYCYDNYPEKIKKSWSTSVAFIELTKLRSSEAVVE